MLVSLSASLTLLVCIIYLVGVQGVTITIHIPLNNRVQNLQVDKLDDRTANQERSVFEAKWNKFNYIRSSISFFVCLAFLAHSGPALKFVLSLYANWITTNEPLSPF